MLFSSFLGVVCFAQFRRHDNETVNEEGEQQQKGGHGVIDDTVARRADTMLLGVCSALNTTAAGGAETGGELSCWYHRRVHHVTIVEYHRGGGRCGALVHRQGG